MQTKKRKEKEHVVKFAAYVSCRKKGKTYINTPKSYMETKTNRSRWFGSG